MDYRFIEQLIERYFACETSLQEEQILKTFFTQDVEQVPNELRPYIPVFAAMQPAETLGDDFDERILAQIGESQTVKARTISLAERFRPLLRAAAVVAVVLTLGNAMNLSIQSGQPQGDDINYAAYQDTFDDPSMAYDQVEDALQLVSDGFAHAQKADSIAMDSLYSELK